MSAFRASDSNVAERAAKLIPNFSAGIQYELIDCAISGTNAAPYACDLIGSIPNEHVTYKIQLIEKALKNQYGEMAVKALKQIKCFPELVRLEIIAKAFTSPNIQVATEAVSLIFDMPKEEHFWLIKKAMEDGTANACHAASQRIGQLNPEQQAELIAFGLRLGKYGVTETVIRFIPGLPKEKQPPLIEKAMEANEDHVCIELCKLIPDFPEEKIESMLAAALKSRGPGTGSKAIEIFTALPPEKQTKNLWNEAIERVKRDLAQNSDDNYLKISAQLKRVPEEHRKTLVLAGFETIKKYIVYCICYLF